MYKELLSFVTTYNKCLASSISIPAGEILLGHLVPSLILSVNFNLLPAVLYCKIQLSFPPLANKYFSSLLNFRPSQLFLISILSKIFSVLISISCRVCLLCPLLVTAIIFFDLLTAIFKGRSPNGKLLPAGLRLQPLGSVTSFCATTAVDKKRKAIQKKDIFCIPK